MNSDMSRYKSLALKSFKRVKLVIKKAFQVKKKENNNLLEEIPTQTQRI